MRQRQPNPYRLGQITEPVDTINIKLRNEFGYAPDADKSSNFRVVWSNSQYEKRWTDRTDSGVALLHPEVRLLPKYQGYKDRYILERFIPIPDNAELVVKMGYEPLWTFQDAMQEYLPPNYAACKFVIEGIFDAIERAGRGHVRYKDPNVDPQYREQQLNKVQEELFGNETAIGDALAHKWGVVSAGDGNQALTPVFPERKE